MKLNQCIEHAKKELPPSIDEEEFQNTDQDLEPHTDDIL